jgi:DNA-binding MltR family transcriptional regulator
MVLICPFCQHKNPLLALWIIRGGSVACDGCGSRIEMKFFYSKPAVRMVGKVEGCNEQGDTESAEVHVVQRPDGLWFFLNDDEAQILETLDHDSDRAVAVIVGAMIENRLERGLKARMRIIDKDALNKVFQFSGPLGSFSAKIDVAYLNGLLSKDAYEDLARFKDIRNKFAHKLDIRTFDSDSVRDSAKNFKLIEEYVAEAQPDTEGKVRALALDVGAKPAVFANNVSMRKRVPRDRYLMTAQLFTVKLATVDLKNYPMPFI